MVFQRFFTIVGITASVLLTACGGGSSSGASTACGGPSLAVSYSWPSTSTTFVGTSVSITPITSGIPVACSGSLNYTANNLPNGMSINSATGVISGAPTASRTTTVSAQLTITGYSPLNTTTLTVTAIVPPSSGVTLAPLITASNANTLTYAAAFAVDLIEDGSLIYFDAIDKSTNLATYLGAGVTTACTTSGTRTRRYIDPDNSGTFTAGDSWVYTYNACVNSGSTTSFTGTDTYSVSAKSGGALGVQFVAWASTITRTRNYSAITSGVGTQTFNNMAVQHVLTVTAQDSLTVISTPLSGFNKTFIPQIGANYTADSFTGATGSVIYSRELYANVPYSKSGTITLTGSDTAINGGATYTIEISHPLSISGNYAGSGVHAAPTSGTFKIFGAGRTSVTVPATFATAYLDTNGDAVTDSSQAISSLSTSLTP